MKRLLTTTALGLMLATPAALAQTSQDPAGQQMPEVKKEQFNPGSETNPAAPAAPEANTQTRPDTGATAEKPADTAQATPGDTYASNLIGLTVENASGDNIGEINDLVLDSEGNVTAALIGVGGFLGMGEKNVALDFTELNIQKGEGDSLRATVAMSAESLQAMPAYEKHEDTAATQGRTEPQTEPMKDQDRVPSGDTPNPNSGERKL